MFGGLWSAFSRRFAGSIYAAMVPVVPGVPAGAEHFLEDLWRLAPIRVALASTLGVLLIGLSPPLVLRRFALFPDLSPEEQERLLVRLMEMRAYPVRLVFYGVKCMALIAVLRDPDCRRGLPLVGDA